MFGIIAGVLIGVWAMYTMLSDEADAQALVRDIQMLQEAAVQFKSAGGTNTYEHLRDYDSPYTDALKPYLGQNSLADGVHVFGGNLNLGPLAHNRDLAAVFLNIPNIDLCIRALSHLGTVTDDGYDTYSIAKGDTIRGFVGGFYWDMGCESYPFLGVTDMYIRID